MVALDIENLLQVRAGRVNNAKLQRRDKCRELSVEQRDRIRLKDVTARADARSTLTVERRNQIRAEEAVRRAGRGLRSKKD